MVYLCESTGCNSHTSKGKNLEKYPWMRDVRWVKFPRDEEARRRWKRLIRRDGPSNYGSKVVKNLVLSRRIRLCSRHFDETDIDFFGYSSADPKYFAWNNWGRGIAAKTFQSGVAGTSLGLPASRYEFDQLTAMNVEEVDSTAPNYVRNMMPIHAIEFPNDSIHNNVNDNGAHHRHDEHEAQLLEKGEEGEVSKSQPDCDYKIEEDETKRETETGLSFQASSSEQPQDQMNGDNIIHRSLQDATEPNSKESVYVISSGGTSVESLSSAPEPRVNVAQSSWPITSTTPTRIRVAAPCVSPHNPLPTLPQPTVSSARPTTSFAAPRASFPRAPPYRPLTAPSAVPSTLPHPLNRMHHMEASVSARKRTNSDPYEKFLQAEIKKSNAEVEKLKAEKLMFQESRRKLAEETSLIAMKKELVRLQILKMTAEMEEREQFVNLNSCAFEESSASP